MEQHRLSNTSYSQLFWDILQRDSCEDLRKYVSTKDSLLMLLNVSFEKPLAVIRSEKSGTSTPLAHLEAHGINSMNSYSSQRKLEIARYSIISKKNQLASLKLDDHANFHHVRDNLQRELEHARRAYSKEIARFSGQKDMPMERLMTVNSLELQLQGFSNQCPDKQRPFESNRERNRGFKSDRVPKSVLGRSDPQTVVTDRQNRCEKVKAGLGSTILAGGLLRYSLACNRHLE